MMLFGPVGHTHNGNDAVHFCHNQIVGNTCSVTLAEYIRAFELGWPNARARPEGLILDTQYDWRALYGDNLQRVGGFSKSVNNDILARGTCSRGMRMDLLQ